MGRKEEEMSHVKGPKISNEIKAISRLHVVTNQGGLLPLGMARAILKMLRRNKKLFKEVLKFERKKK